MATTMEFVENEILKLLMLIILKTARVRITVDRLKKVSIY